MKPALFWYPEINRTEKSDDGPPLELFLVAIKRKKSVSADAFVSLFLFSFSLTQNPTQNDKTFSLQSISFLFFT